MGYKPTADAATKITFDDFPGLEVYAETPTMGALMDVADVKLNMNDTGSKRMRAFEMFAQHIKTWNIDHPEPKNFKIIETDENNVDVLKVCARCGLAEDAPLPTTAEHMMCLPMKFIMPVFFGWLSVVSRVDPTKYMNFNNGGNDFQGALMKQLEALQNPIPSSVPNMS